MWMDGWMDRWTLEKLNSVMCRLNVDLWPFQSPYLHPLQVLVPKKPEFKGKMIEVDIFEAGKHFLRGRPVEDSTVITPSISQPLEKGEISGLSQVSFSFIISITTSHTHTHRVSLLPGLEDPHS